VHARASWLVDPVHLANCKGAAGGHACAHARAPPVARGREFASPTDEEVVMATLVREGRTNMEGGMRAGLIILGLALGILWIVGLSNHVAAWLVWTVFCVAVASLLLGLVPTEVPSAVMASPVALGIALLVLWIIGLAAGTTTWMVWWTFGFGIAYVLLGFASAVPEGRRAGPRPI
jgi:hypothetical protein